MKAAVYHGPGDLRVEERPVPHPAANQLLVKVEYVGICGTDVHAYAHAGLIEPGRVIGHETLGTVAAIGAGVEGFAVGQRLLCGPPTQCAALCPACRNGTPNICETALPRTAGIGNVDGGYAEYLLVPDVRHTMLLPVAASVDPQEAVLFDVVCVALHAIRKSRFRVGDSVVVSGAGPIGLATVGMLRFAGAGRIIALETDATKFDAARALGADVVLDPATHPDLRGAIRAQSGSGVGADVVFECVGNSRSVGTSISACVRPGGQVMLVGVGADPLGVTTASIVAAEVDLQSSFVYTSDEVRAYLDLLAAGRIRFKSLVTDVIRLEDCVGRGIERLRQSGSGQVKILIRPGS